MTTEITDFVPAAPPAPVGVTHVAVVLDRSGSMGSVKADTIGGYNQFLAKTQEAAQPGDQLLFTQFDNIHDIAPSVALTDAKPLDATTFLPRGGTALYDAIADTVQALAPAVRDADRALVMILTDGQENSSQHTTQEQVKHLVDNFIAKGNWTFVFLMAGPDQFVHAIARGMGFAQGNVMAYAAGSAGMQSAWDSTASSSSAYTSNRVDHSTYRYFTP